MKFRNYRIIVDEEREASIEDCEQIIRVGKRSFRRDNQKFLYSIDMKIVENRFLWISCDYDDANSFREFVVNESTGGREPNPRRKNQIELRQQLFACYDCELHNLYLNDVSKRNFLEQYLGDSSQKEFRIINIYSSVDEFCKRVKTIREFRYTQVDNLFTRNSDLFKQVGSIFGLDLPSKIQLKIGCGNLPVHGNGKMLIDTLCRGKDKDEFSNVIVIGCDDKGVEQAFDFSSLLKCIEISPQKDENEHYDPQEVLELILRELR